MVSRADGRGPARYTRRRFLQGIGTVTAGSVAMGTTGLVGEALRLPALGATASGSAMDPTHFGRIFGKLPAFAPPSDQLTAALTDIGRPGGILDAADDLAAGPKKLALDKSLSLNNPDNPLMPEGATFIGQFIDHDMTFDATSTLDVPVRPKSIPNQRTPSFDLDSVYGAGPTGSPALYDPADTKKFLVESGGLFEDLPRNPDLSAILADPRNDENLVLSGMHCAFMLFHNHVVDLLRSQGVAESDVFAQSQQTVVWHYQWLILHEFLPMYVGSDLVNTVLTQGRTFYRPRLGMAFIPIEFQGAAYRFGHSMVRPSYRANLAGDAGKPFFAFIFDTAHSEESDPDDLSGGHRAPRRFIAWQSFFDFGDGQMHNNKKIDTKISSPLLNLPIRSLTGEIGYTSLPQRNLLRQVTWSMPSGQDIANRLGLSVLTSSDLAELQPYGLGLETSTPLWYYILKEAELMQDGQQLGPLGGRLVCEVILGLLQTDVASFLVVQPGWTPTLPQRSGQVTGDFQMVDLLAFAGVDPTSRGQ